MSVGQRDRRLRPLKSSIFPTLCRFTPATRNMSGISDIQKVPGISTLCTPSYHAFVTKTKTEAQSLWWKTQSIFRRPGAKSSLETRVCIRLKCQAVQDGALSQVKIQIASPGVLPGVPGIKVRTMLVKFLRKYSSRLIRLPLLTGSRRQVVREE